MTIRPYVSDSLMRTDDSYTSWLRLPTFHIQNVPPPCLTMPQATLNEEDFGGHTATR